MYFHCSLSHTHTREALAFVQVSSRGTADVQARLVRVHCADANPHGPGICEEDLAAVFSTTFTGARQAVTKGSYGIIDILPGGAAPQANSDLRTVFRLDGQDQLRPDRGFELPPTRGFSLTAYVFPTLMVRQRQRAPEDKSFSLFRRMAHPSSLNTGGLGYGWCRRMTSRKRCSAVREATERFSWASAAMAAHT